MELSQPRPRGGEPGAKPTHDFLSLYSPAAHQDPSPTIPGSYLKTHNFLQPLEQVGKNVCEEVEYTKKSLPPAAPTVGEHILPGGMGTYSISHIPHINQTQKVSKPEGIVISAAQSSSSNNNDENSNCSSYTGSGFTLWEESNANKGKTRKENNIAGNRHTMRDGGIKFGVPWMTSMEQPSKSSSINNHPGTTFSSLSSSHRSSAPKSQYFVDMKSGRNFQEVEDINEGFVIKKEPFYHHKGSISTKADTASSDKKPNSPRSKHSATEQRRRSKINDRHVIEYIQFLQEKVHKYEDSSQRWTNEPPKTIPINDFIHQPQIPTRQNLLDSNMISHDATNETSQHPQSTNKPSASAAASYEQISTPDTATTASQAQELIIEGGTISISTIYSQRLASALTQALNSSGVDLSHANISVQIDLGKRSNTSRLESSPPDLKENDTRFNDQSIARSRLVSTWEDENDQGFDGGGIEAAAHGGRLGFVRFGASLFPSDFWVDQEFLINISGIFGGSWRFLADSPILRNYGLLDLGVGLLVHSLMSVDGFTDDEFVVYDPVTLISRLNVSNPLHLHPNDSAALTVVFVKLKGIENYQVWSCAMLLALEGKNKIGFIDGSCRRLNALWKQSDTLIELPRCTCHAAEDFKKHVCRLEVIFSLEKPYLIWGVLMLLSLVRSAYATISSEESHKVASGSISGTSQKSQTSAFVFNMPNSGNFLRNQTSSNTPIPIATFRPNYVKNNIQGGGSGLVCENCGFNGHTIDKCFKLIGYHDGSFLHREKFLG
ncbi:transcription factor BIM1 isoform X1 [Tanacetum coccineum]